jgi:hypothetical protein
MSKMKNNLLLVGRVLVKTMIVVIISIVISLLLNFFTGKPLMNIVETIAIIIVFIGGASLLGDMVVRGNIQYNLTKFLHGPEKSTKADRELTYDGYTFSFYTCLAGAILFLITIFIYYF